MNAAGAGLPRDRVLYDVRASLPVLRNAEGQNSPWHLGGLLHGVVQQNAEHTGQIDDVKSQEKPLQIDLHHDIVANVNVQVVAEA